MGRSKVTPAQYEEDTYTNTSWTIQKLGNVRIATRKLTIASLGATSSTSLSMTLPDGKTFNDVNLTHGINNNGAYVEYIVVGTQYADTGTNANVWVRNTGAGTTGKLTITFTCIYEA